MSKIFKNLIPYWRWIILIFVFLIAQAYCDLALPAYTSDIIDVGIQDHGIEHILPKEITSKDYQMAQTFMLSDEKEKFTDCYEAEDASKSDNSVAKYKLTADSDTLDKLDEELLVPLVMAYQAFQSGEQMDVDASAIPQSAALDDTMIKQIRSKVQDKIDAVGSSTLKSMGVTFATKCDENAGIDVDANQVAYLWKAGAKMAAFAAIMLIAACVVGFAASKVGAAVGRDLREKTFSKVVGFSNAEINKFSTASLITRSTNDIQQIQMVTTMMLRMVLYAPIVGIGGIIKVAQTKSGMEWVIAIAVAAIMVFIFTLVGIAMPKFKIMQSLVDKVNLVSREILTGLSVIRAFGREKEEEKRFDEANRELTRTQLFTNRVMTFMMPGMSMIMYCITLGIVWVAAGRIDKGSMQVGTMTAFITYAMMIVMSFLMLSAMSIMLPRAGVAAERIDEVIRTNSTVNDPKEPVTEAEHRGVIHFNHVDFRYPGAKEDVLSDIDFLAEPGKITAIIGSTGCGKSTLVNLIPRFYDVTGGSIELDGHDIRDYTLSELRESIGFVPQKGILFSGTIASNLRFGKADASDEQIKKAADIAQASEFIETKNDRYESSIAQGGSNVSGGQKQRLAIARAIAKDPHIYVFDDSFSALDMKTDARLRAALAEVTENASVIIVAQRISTIIHADQILVLDDGKIVGKGTHEELLKNCDVYMQIAQSQLSAKELGLDDKVAETATDKAADTSAVSGLDNEKEGM
jgi:ATP-binding cassette subfamily B multidrug efflux pump